MAYIMKKIIFSLLGIVLFTYNLQGQSTIDKLCKTWHMNRTITLYENAKASNNKLNEEYWLSYLKFNRTNMTFAYNGLTKQDDGSYKEYYVHTGSWKLIDNQQRLVQYNKAWDINSKDDVYFIISLTDSELILMEERQFDKTHYTDGRIGIGFIWVYYCDNKASQLNNSKPQQTQIREIEPPPPPLRNENNSTQVNDSSFVVETNYGNIETMPQLIGGEDALKKFISHNLKYPVLARKNGIEGRVIAQFVVTKNGYIEKAEIIRPLDPECDEEALRIIKLLPKFIPGVNKDGINVNVRYTLPITFKLDL